MGTTTAGVSICAAALGGSYGTNKHYIAVGTDDTTFVSGNTTLGAEFDRNRIDTNDLSVNEQVTMFANWSPNDVSGLVMKEFGTFTTGSAMLNREVLTGSLVFDGEQELQIKTTIIFKT